MVDHEGRTPTFTTRQATTFVAVDPFSRQRTRMGLLHHTGGVSVFGIAMEDKQGRELVSLCTHDDGASGSMRYDDTDAVEFGVSTDRQCGFWRLMDRTGRVRVAIEVADDGEITTRGLEGFLAAKARRPDPLANN